VVIRRPVGFDPAPPWNRVLQIGPEQFEIDNRVQPLKIITLGGESLQTLVDIEKPSLPPIPNTTNLEKPIVSARSAAPAIPPCAARSL